jgi:hypothetical protein
MLLSLLSLFLIVAVLCLFHRREIRGLLRVGWPHSPYKGAAGVDTDGADAATRKPRLPLRCGECGSRDIWRMQERSGVVAAVMKRRGLKLFK